MKRKKDYNEATKSAVNTGNAILYTFKAFDFITLLSGEIIGGIWVLLFSWFLRSGAESYLAQIRLTSILSRTYLRDIMNTNIISVKPDLTANELLLDYFNKYMKSAFPVIDERKRLLGLVILARLLAVLETNLSRVKTEDVMIHRSVLVVMNEYMTAESALMQMTQKLMGKVFVCNEETDELVGTVSKTDVLNVEMEWQEIAQTIRKSGSSNSKVSGAI